MNKLLFLIPATLIVTGCGMARVIDVDVEKLEAQRLKNTSAALKEEPTPGHVIVADKSNVRVEVEKTRPTREEKVDLETWNVNVFNNNSVNQCVSIAWKLMDFRFMSYETTEFFVAANSSKKIGQMIQETWIIDGVKIAPPGSGFVKDIRVRGTIPNAKPGEQCMYIEEGKND
jgi:hypothetical protein